MIKVVQAVAAVTLAMATLGGASAQSTNLVEAALLQHLQQAYHVEGPLRFRAVDVDLDADGTPETIAFIDEPGLCGTGGCDTLVLKRVANGYRTVTTLSVSHLPIRVLRTRSHGWSNLGVTVGGGGILVAYEARLRFDGRSYPTNPSVPPAEPLARMTGKIVLAAQEEHPARPPSALDVLLHLDLTSFPNSVGPRRVAGRKTPRDYGFTRLRGTATEATAEQPNRHWIISLDSLVSAGPLLNACFRDRAKNGGSYNTSTPLKLRRESDGGYTAAAEGAGLGLAGCPSVEPPLIR